jgi:hypothetical protein
LRTWLKVTKAWVIIKKHSVSSECFEALINSRTELEQKKTALIAGSPTPKGQNEKIERKI